jgi:hypothetical protein
MQRRFATGLAVAMVLMVPESARPDLARFRVRDLNPMHAAAVEHALAGAVHRLERDECRRIFADFRDGAGASLQDRLDRLGVGARDYLSLVVFADGYGQRSCRGTDVMAVTAPGSRVVRVCGRRFFEVQARSPERAELVVLHEALHTLGLGENPPDSLEITRRVGERCKE